MFMRKALSPFLYFSLPLVGSRVTATNNQSFFFYFCADSYAQQGLSGTTRQHNIATFCHSLFLSTHLHNCLQGLALILTQLSKSFQLNFKIFAMEGIFGSIEFNIPMHFLLNLVVFYEFLRQNRYFFLEEPFGQLIVMVVPNSPSA